ncbi:MAG: 16S rRNA (guanine(966)-N(2))-methyltransferase RsmD [Bacillota bacterium]
MRIIAGSAKKRVLKVPAGWTGRPTADRVKESLFNILGNSVIGCNFLDLFAGTGNVGIEALSRGALKAVFVEKDRLAATAIRQNIKLTGFENNSKVIIKDVYTSLAELKEMRETFNLVFLDPPYGKGFEIPVINTLVNLDLLASDGILVAESSKRETMPPEITNIKLIRQERYGDTMLSFYKLT